jgi:hypothetical protein
MTIHRFDRFVRKAAAAKWRLLNVGNRTWAAEAGDFADGRRRRGRQPACECSGAGPRPELSVLFGVISRCNGARQWHGVEAVRTGRSKRRLAPSSTMPDGDQPARRGRPARKLPSCRGAPGHDRPDLANPQHEANEWIAKDLQDWLDRRERIKVRKDRCRERQRGGALDREG